MSVENGSAWVPYLLTAMDNMKGMGRNGPWPGGYVEGKPTRSSSGTVRLTAPLRRRTSPGWYN